MQKVKEGVQEPDFNILPPIVLPVVSESQKSQNRNTEKKTKSCATHFKGCFLVEKDFKDVLIFA